MAVLHVKSPNGTQKDIDLDKIVTGVKGNSESSYRTGDVNITAANIGAATYDHNHDSEYLPLSGGTMTGELVYGKSQRIRTNSSANYLGLCGGSEFANGANIYLFGNTNSDETLKGAFRITAIKSDGTTAQLYGYPNGDLKWNGTAISLSNHNHDSVYAKLASPALTGTPTAPTASVSTDSTQIATTAYVKDCVPKSIGGAQRPVYTNSNGVITACTATGTTGGLEGVNIGISSANGASYIRYESGLQIAWGSQASVGTTTVTVSFPAAFASYPNCAESTTSNNCIVNIYDVSTTNFKTHIGTGTATSTHVRWIAMGKWK